MSVWHESFGCVTWLIRMCTMTHSYVYHDSFVCVPWSFTCLTWHICDGWGWPHESCHTCEWSMSHISMSHDFYYRPRLCHKCDMTHSCGWHDSFTYDKNHCYVHHDSFMSLIGHASVQWVMTHIWNSHVTRMDASCPKCGWVMPHVCMSSVTCTDESRHVTRMNKSCNTARMNESCGNITYRPCVLNWSCRMDEWFMSNIRMSQVTHMDESHNYPRTRRGEVGGWGRDPKKCTGRDWGMGSSTI